MGTKHSKTSPVLAEEDKDRSKNNCCQSTNNIQDDSHLSTDEINATGVCQVINDDQLTGSENDLKTARKNKNNKRGRKNKQNEEVINSTKAVKIF